MKKSYSQKKSIREVKTKKNYSGEASPYWDHMQQRQRSEYDGSITEDKMANPDMLSEQDTMYPSVNEENQEKIQLLKSFINELSPRQKRVFVLYTMDGLSLKQIAQKLGISLSSVQVFLRRAVLFIRKKYETCHKID